MIRLLILFSLFSWNSLAEERLPGGVSATVKDTTSNAFGHPFPALSRELRRQFFVGNSFFRLAWVQAPASTEGRDGLGPTFNAVSCSSCHLRDGRGRGGREGGVEISLLYRFSDNPHYGNQLNPFAIENVPGEAMPLVRYLNRSGRYPDGSVYELREPVVEFADWAFGEPSKDLRVSARSAPQLIGLGLLEKIPTEAILENADPEDQNQDGISGEASWVLNIENGAVELGRFGWKAEQPSVKQQNAAAFLGDMGLTTSLFFEENCPPPQVQCRQARSGGNPEVDDQQLDRVTLYVQSLAVPERRDWEDPQTLRGQRLFNEIGCASCHQPRWRIEEGWDIYPYTDMLLHDMGAALADRSLDGKTLTTRWRTPPLWGVGLIPAVNHHQELLHDGRARNVEEAILWHGGEAAASKERFVHLEKTQREDLTRFVNSL